MEHTETPWLAGKPVEVTPGCGAIRFYVEGKPNMGVVRFSKNPAMGLEQAKANLNFLIHAVNQHERLVEGLRKLYDVLMQDGKPPFVGEGDERVYQLVGGQMSNTLDIIRALLAEEEKEESHAND